MIYLSKGGENMSIHKFKRTLSMFCALGMVVSVAACSAPAGSTSGTAGTGAAEKGAVLKVAYWESSSSDKAGWDLMFANFAKDHPEIKLEPQVYPSNTFRQTLDTRIAGNDWPDIVRYTYQRLGKFKENNVMLDLKGKISEESLSDLVPAFRAAATYEGKLVAMPHHTDTMAIFYNKAMFEKSGIRIPKNATDGWTWEELTANARKLKADNNLEYAFGGIWENGSGYRYLPFIYMNGGSVLSKDMKSITINSPEALAATKLYETWQKEKLVVKTGFTQEPVTNLLFVAKKIAFTFSGSWHLSYMEENMPGNWGVTYMPQVKGKSGSDMGGNSIFAYARTKYPNAAAIFIDYMTNKANMKAFAEASNFIPVRTSLINEGLKYTSFQKEMDLMLNIVKTIDPKLADDETSTRFQQINQIYGEIMDPIAINGSMTAEKALEKAQKDMTEALK
jgi:multiple sugar transport system substrate-binding protein